MTSKRDAVRYGLSAAAGVILLAAAGVASNAFANGWHLLPGLILASLVIVAAILVFVGEVRSRLVTSSRSAGVASAMQTPPVVGGHDNMLPRDLADFTGRQREVTAILNAIRISPAGQQQVQVLALHGIGGIGKTALAVHIAHSVADRYRDATLYIDLRAHTDGQLSLDPSTALEVLLTSLGVPGSKIPAAIDARAAQWRSLLAQRRTLIVLDNVSNTAQVRPLLPGGGTSLVLITSRERLVDLDDVSHFSIKNMSNDDSVTLFERIMSATSKTIPTSDVRRLVDSLGCIPLAIRLAAGRLLSHPTWDVSNLISELEHAGFSPNSGGASVTINRIFELSYRELDPSQKRFFYYLGLSPGPNFTEWSGASLANVSRDEANRRLEELYYANLLEEVQPGRYHFHDLLKQYSAGLAKGELSSLEQGDARQRLFDFYLATAEAADYALRPLRRPPAKVTTSTQGIPRDQFDGFSEALGWFDPELPNLLACVRRCIDDHIGPHAWRLMTALGYVIRMRDAYSSGLILLNEAATLADQSSDLLGAADIHREIGVCQARMTYYKPARLNARRALSIYLKLGDLYGQANANRDLGHLDAHEGRHAGGRRHASKALTIYSKLGIPYGVSYALADLGVFDLLDGLHESSRPHLLEALKMSVALDDQYGQFRCHLALGGALLHSQENESAQTHLEQARKISTSMNNRLGQAGSYEWLGLAKAIKGSGSEAKELWVTALKLYEEIDHSAVATVQQYLNQLRLHGTSSFTADDLRLREILW